jgi:serine/threonine-protein kinase
LLLLGCLGAFTGIVLARALRGPVEPPARTAAPPQPTVESIAPASAPPTPPTPLQVDDPRVHAPAVPREAPAAAAPLPAHGDVDVDVARESSARAPGTLLVAFEGGWAEVYLGTNLLGTTPARFELPAGRHTLLIKPFGTEASFKRRVDVQPATVTKLFLSAQQRE